MTICPGCAQQRYPDEPWTDETHPFYQVLPGWRLQQIFSDGSLGPILPAPEIRLEDHDLRWDFSL